MTTLTRAGLTETGAMKKSSVHINIGCVVWCAGNITPAGTLYCDGSAVSRTTYAELFSAIGTTYGAGDGSTTFNLPDLRGQFVRGTGGSAAALGTAQEDAIRELVGSFTITGRYDGVTSYGTFPIQDVGGACEISFTAVGMNVSSYQTTPIPQPAGVRLRASKTVPTAAENRPTNYAMRPCIIFE